MKKKKMYALIVIDAIILVSVIVLAVVSITKKDDSGEMNKQESPSITKEADIANSSTKEPIVDTTEVPTAVTTDVPTVEPTPIPTTEPTPTKEPTATPTPTEEPVVTPTVAADYKQGLDGLSTKLVGWCYERKKNNEPSGTYEPFDIEPYGAYFRNIDVDEGDKVIYFSFDCGYEYGYTEKILDTLKKHNIKATFFVTKSFLDTDAELAKRMKEEGHIVGNHTLHHPSLALKSDEEVYNEVKGLADLFKEKTGYELDPYIRPPMGEYSERVLKELQNMGYTTIFWSIAYGDYDVDNQPGKDYVVDHFKNYHHNGAITLTHTVSKSNCEALDDVLTYLEEQGYRFGSLAEVRAQSYN